MLRIDTLQITPEVLSLIAKIDEFKRGGWVERRIMVELTG
jgi:hypothetical protein